MVSLMGLEVDHMVNFGKTNRIHLIPLSTLAYCRDRHTIGGVAFYEHISC